MLVFCVEMSSMAVRQGARVPKISDIDSAANRCCKISVKHSRFTTLAIIPNMIVLVWRGPRRRSVKGQECQIYGVSAVSKTDVTKISVKHSRFTTLVIISNMRVLVWRGPRQRSVKRQECQIISDIGCAENRCYENIGKTQPIYEPSDYCRPNALVSVWESSFATVR